MEGGLGRTIGEDPVRRLRLAVQRVFDDDIDPLDDATIGGDIIRIHTEINRLEAQLCRRIRRFEKQRGHESTGSTSIVSWLRSRCLMSAGNASRHVETGRRLEDLETTEDAFRRGAISFDHAATIARTVRHVGAEPVQVAEPTLVESAQQVDAGQFRMVTSYLRHCVDPDGALVEAKELFERRYLNLSQTFGGVWSIDGVLDPEGGALLKCAIDSCMPVVPSSDTRAIRQRRADAVVEMASRMLQTAPARSIHGQRPHLTLLATAGTVSRAPGSPPAEIEGSSHIHVETVRRLACDASVTTVHVSTGGVITGADKTSRLIPAATRTALAARDRGCRFPGCDRPPQWTDAHHIHHWADGGPTTLENLVLLCRWHHRFVHEEGWVLRRAAPAADIEFVEPEDRRDWHPPRGDRAA